MLLPHPDWLNILPPPHFLAQGRKREAHHFELQPLGCIVCSGKVINSHPAVHYPSYLSNNKQPAGPLILSNTTAGTPNTI